MVLGAIVIVVVGLLVVNYFRGLDTGTTLPVGEQAEQIGPTVTRGGQTFHIVQSGDTLWSVAEKYYDPGYNWVDVARANSLTNPGLIETGQELEIPDVEPKLATIQASVLATTSSDETDAISGASYTVSKGDSLWVIAVRAYGDGYRWVDIAGENELADPNIIHPGNVLTLPR